MKVKVSNILGWGFRSVSVATLAYLSYSAHNFAATILFGILCVVSVIIFGIGMFLWMMEQK